MNHRYREGEFSMKQTKFSEEQIAMALHLAEQTSVEEVTRKLGIAQATFTDGN